ncbi:AGAP010049-PA-like protein [Anopheles sinensis]|uniref:AGAP010049-PA-like protein n=1 Tax=Anopheles sinensis TaxID=74873 RepID=A0A084VBE1_ANOSI|nr:AGAP010049-PA-like protein [Anopheles sinensis]
MAQSAVLPSATGGRMLEASNAPHETVITKPSVPLSRLHEKINTLDCEIQAIAPESSVWRGNETHELQLPAMVSTGDCRRAATRCCFLLNLRSASLERNDVAFNYEQYKT